MKEIMVLDAYSNNSSNSFFPSSLDDGRPSILHLVKGSSVDASIVVVVTVVVEVGLAARNLAPSGHSLSDGISAPHLNVFGLSYDLVRWRMVKLGQHVFCDPFVG